MSATDAFAEFERQWFEAHPEQRLAALFLAPALRRRTHAFGCLVHELERAAFHLSEPQVAAAKLDWWAQELTRAVDGGARHPVTQALFGDDTLRALDPTIWSALAEGAHSQLDQPGGGTLSALFEQLDPFYAAVARADSALFCAGQGNIEANAALWKISHLLHELSQLHLSEQHLPLPLGLLARYGVTRAELKTATPARNMLIKDFLDELALEMDGALGVISARTLTQCVRVRLDRRMIAGALRADDPLGYLVHRHRAHGWRTLWVVWREARATAWADWARQP